MEKSLLAPESSNQGLRAGKSDAGDAVLHPEGDADARNISFSASPLLNGTNTSLYCNVTDSNSTAVVPNYNVSFWKNDSFLGSNLTNASGLASLVYADTTSVGGGAR